MSTSAHKKGVDKWFPAVTFRSVMASVLAMLGTAAAINYVHVVLVAHSPGEHSLVIPGLWVVLAMLAVSAIFRFRILSRPELLCVLYAVLLSGPMMSQGFWHRIVSITSTIPRGGDFALIDAYSDKLWPVGENLIATNNYAPGIALEWRGTVRLEEIDHTAGTGEAIPVLENKAAHEESALRINIPSQTDDTPGVMSGTPYLISVLVRPHDLAGDSAYFIRVYAADSDRYDELLYSRLVRSPSVIHPQGFQREGVYAYQMPSELPAGGLVVEFGLQGTGRLDVADPQVRSVLALEQIFTGRLAISRAEYEALPPSLRHGLLVKPDRWLSLDGARHLLAGPIPWGAWFRPMLAWGGFLTLLLTGTLCIAVLMRRKWIDNERYALPLTRIPLALIGEPDATESIWRNRLMWIGFAFSLGWCLLKIFSFYNTAIPNPGIEVNLAPYFGPQWGETWHITFTVFAVFVSIAIFIELNILISFVIGFFIFRLFYWYGYVTGMDAIPGFPYAQEQQIGGYMVYAFLVLAFSRRYLVEIVKEAASRNAPDRGELFSYRTAFLIFFATVGGTVVWARWIDVSVGGMLLFMGFLWTIGFVAMKIRAECGVAYGYFTPNNAALVVMLAGGIGAFGPQFVLLTFVASFFVTVSVLMLIPGAQLEIIEIGRRYGIRPRHIILTCLLGLVGGILIGGWSFLSMSYAWGGDTLRYAWAYDAKPWYFGDFNRALAVASATWAETGQMESTVGGASTQWIGYAWGAGGTAVLTILRQFFAGFWLHPLGFILGSTHMIGGTWISLWGSILTAWVIRSVVVKIGGAETVRTKLNPFFVGVFLAAVLANLIAVIHAAWLRHQGVELIFNQLL